MMRHLLSLIKVPMRVILATFLLLQSGHQYPLQAAFDDLGRGARAPGMADVFVGIADDPNAMYYNPAGLAQLRNPELTAEYGQLFRGADDGSNLGTTYLGYIYPLRGAKWGTLGFSYHNFAASNLFDERTLSISYGRAIKMQPFGWKGTWLLGGSIKQLHREFTPDRFSENALNDVGVATGQVDPLFGAKGFSSTNYALDVAALYRFGRQNRYSAGLSLVNVNRPDVSLGKTGDRAPFMTKLGLGYRPKWGVMSVELRRTRRVSSSPDTDVALGAERKFTFSDLGALTVRGGYAEGSREFKAATAGMSYQFGKAIVDYAFNFPIGNLSDLQGSHRIGLSFQVGTQKRAETRGKDLADQDLLAAFAFDAKAAHALISRAGENDRINNYERALLLQLLIRKYSLDDPSLGNIRRELSTRLGDFKSGMATWPEIKGVLLKKLSANDQLNAQDALNRLIKGDTKFSLARLVLLSESAKSQGPIQAVTLMSLAELAARAYREDDLTGTLDKLRQMISILPEDPVLMAAYRQLLLDETQAREPQIPLAPVDDVVSEDPIVLPEAPAVLTAPKPVDPEKQKKSELTEEESLAKRYGESLGYYFRRKAENAGAKEQQRLLEQMLKDFSATGLDMSLIESELNALPSQVAPQPKAVPQPKVAPPVEPQPKPVETKTAPEKKKQETVAPKTQPKKAIKPKAPQKKKQIKKRVAPKKKSQVKKRVKKAAPAKKAKKKLKPKVKKRSPRATKARALNRRLQKAWLYYNKAVEQGLTNKERIEILEGILKKFGDREAPKVLKELKKIKNRVD